MSGSNKNTGPLDAVAILATMRRERSAAGGAVMNFSGEWVYAVIDHYARRERGLLLTNNVYLERARSAETDLGRVERNRDMWKGQVDRQAEEITRLRAELAKAEALIKEIAAREVAELNKPTPSVVLTYTNYCGETAERRIIPFEVWFGSTEWHPEPQWLLRAYDCEKKAERDFALKDFGARVSDPNGHDPTDIIGLRDALAATRSASATGQKGPDHG